LLKQLVYSSEFLDEETPYSFYFTP
jgi:hypothetical protein